MQQSVAVLAENGSFFYFILYCPHLIVTLTFGLKYSRSGIKIKAYFILYSAHIIVSLKLRFELISVRKYSNKFGISLT